MQRCRRHDERPPRACPGRARQARLLGMHLEEYLARGAAGDLPATVDMECDAVVIMLYRYLQANFLSVSLSVSLSLCLSVSLSLSLSLPLSRSVSLSSALPLPLSPRTLTDTHSPSLSLSPWRSCCTAAHHLRACLRARRLCLSLPSLAVPRSAPPPSPRRPTQTRFADEGSFCVAPYIAHAARAQSPPPPPPPPPRAHRLRRLGFRVPSETTVGAAARSASCGRAPKYLLRNLLRKTF